MDKKKLLVTASTFPRWKDDTEPRFVLDLCRGLTDYFDVTVLAPACLGAADREIIEGISVIRYHYFPVHRWETLCYPGAIVPRVKEKKIRALLVPFLFLGLWRALFKHLPQYDLVHAHWLIPQGIVQSFFKKPYIVTGHGGDVTSLNKGILRRLKIRCLKKARAVTVVSEALKTTVLEMCPVQNISVLSMGCDTEKFGPQFRKENYFGQGEEKVVLFVGRLVEIKGVTYLIDAIQNMNDVMLAIVGSGPLEEQLRKQAEPISERVHFLGSKTHDELREIYASSDVFVTPSITASDGATEGLGLVLLEAMASGIPVIGSDSGGIPEIIRDGYNGFLVPEKNVEELRGKICRVLDDENLREQFVANGMQTAKERCYSNIAEKYAEILNENMYMRSRACKTRKVYMDELKILHTSQASKESES